MQLLAEESTQTNISQQDAAWNLWQLVGENLTILWKDWPQDMQAQAIDTSKNLFSLVGTCPHCRRDSVFVQVTNVHTASTRVDHSHVGPVMITTMVVAMRCQGCLNYILGVVDHRPDLVTYVYVAHYPLGKPDDKVDSEIPQAIAEDFKEALRCLWVDAYNATAEMCRRAIEASCIDLGAPVSAKSLEDKIDWLESQRKITPFLKDVAHKIRLGGNRAAHPGNATPPGGTSTLIPEPRIERDHAQAIVKFTREFFHHVYVVPKQLDKYDFSKPKASAAKVTGTPAAAPQKNP